MKSAQPRSLTGVYAQFSEAHPWVRIAKVIAGQLHYWDRHPWHVGWIPAWHPRVQFTGYRRAQEAKRSLRTAKLRGQGAFLVDSTGAQITADNSPNTHARRAAA